MLHRSFSILLIFKTYSSVIWSTYFYGCKRTSFKMKVDNKLEYMKALCYGKHFSMARDSIQNTQRILIHTILCLSLMLCPLNKRLRARAHKTTVPSTQQIFVALYSALYYSDMYKHSDHILSMLHQHFKECISST
jgi:hypothetical protein